LAPLGLWSTHDRRPRRYTTINANPAFGIDPFEVKLIGRQNPIAKDLLDIRGAAASGGIDFGRLPRLAWLLL
jgi:hypothetical protein